MSLEEEVRQRLNDVVRQAIRSTALRPSVACKVLSVSADPIDGLMICDCAPIDGTSVIEDVKLIADENYYGFILVPKVDSVVIVSFKSDSDAFVSMVSSVDAIYLNGNDKGGLINIDDLISQYDLKLAAIKSAISTALATHDSQLAALGQPGGAAAAFNSAAALITGLNKSTLENTIIKHGTGSLI